MSDKTWLKNCVVLLCVTSLLMPAILADNGGSANSLQPEITPINTTQKESSDGLQNSSWPMFHHDVRHTGRSSYGVSGNWYEVKWKFLRDGMFSSSPAFDENGTIYIGQDGLHNTYFFAINPNGTEKWHFAPGDWVDSSPAISSDGTIYFGTHSSNLIALHQNGTLQWSTHIGEGWVFSSPAISNDGTIYAAAVGGSDLCAVSPNGTIKWRFNATNWIYSSPVIDDNGIIYIGSHDHYLYAVYPNGTLKWKFQTNGEVKSPPSIGDDGTIYVCSWDNYLYAINPNGTLKWKFGTGDATETSPAIAQDGTIYIGSYDKKIYSIAPNGTKNWAYQTSDSVLSSPAIDKYGTIYCGSFDGNLYTLNPNGTLRWKFDTGDSTDSSPVIGEDGTIYIANWGGYLYALKIINNQPPSTPSINGPVSGKAKQIYNYSIISTDPEGNNISYYVDWGDGINTGWIGLFTSGYELTVNHTWSKRGSYIIKAKAIDNYSAESGWSTLQVTMPLVYEPPHFRFLDWLFERFPHAFPILRQLLGY